MSSFCGCGHSLDAHAVGGGSCYAGIWTDGKGEGVWVCSCSGFVLKIEVTDDEDIF